MLTQYKALHIINLCSNHPALIDTDAHICFSLHSQISQVAFIQTTGTYSMWAPWNHGQGKMNIVRR